MKNIVKSVFKYFINIMVWCKSKTINYVNWIRDENGRDMLIIFSLPFSFFCYFFIKSFCKLTVYTDSAYYVVIEMLFVFLIYILLLKIMRYIMCSTMKHVFYILFLGTLYLMFIIYILYISSFERAYSIIINLFTIICMVIISSFVLYLFNFTLFS